MFRAPPQPVVQTVAQPAPAQPAPPGNIPAPTVQASITPGAAPNGVVPEVAPVTVEGNGNPQNPLDQFKDLWQTAPIDPNAPGTPAAPAPLTAEQLTASMSKANFTNTLDPSLMTAIAAGGEEAGVAFTTALDQVARQIMVQSTLVNNKLTEQAVAHAEQKATANIPDMLRQQATSNHLVESNPVFQNPAIKPFVESAQQQLLIKHPTATPAELTVLTNDLMSAISETFAPATPIDPAVAAGTDWDKFL